MFLGNTLVSFDTRNSKTKDVSQFDLCPKSDQHEFSFNNLHTLSRGKVMRINKMITKGERL